MPDLSHTFGGDLAVSANGDLLTADSLSLSQQRVLRRLLTNPGDYIWQPNYGAGLPAMIGQPISVAAVQSTIIAQMYLERTVMRNPAPVVTVSPLANGMFVQIQYTEADSQLPTVLRFSVNNS